MRVLLVPVALLLVVSGAVAFAGDDEDARAAIAVSVACRQAPLPPQAPPGQVRGVKPWPCDCSSACRCDHCQGVYTACPCEEATKRLNAAPQPYYPAPVYGPAPRLVPYYGTAPFQGGGGCAGGNCGVSGRRR